jgi:hypothetical protein
MPFDQTLGTGRGTLTLTQPWPLGHTQNSTQLEPRTLYEISEFNSKPDIFHNSRREHLTLLSIQCSSQCYTFYMYMLKLSLAPQTLLEKSHFHLTDDCE